ncbi:MAG: TIM-barrel domain-containing protein [Silvibacterium sp.]
MKKRTDSRGYWLRAIALTVVASAVGAAAQPAPHADVVTGAQQEASAELIHLTTGTLRIRPCEGDIARVTYVPGPTIPDLSNPALPDSACSPAAFTVQRPAGGIEIVAEGLRIEVNKNSGAVRFSDAQGKPMLAESDWPFPRNVTDTVTDGQPTHEASVWFALTPEERLYGLGQHQTGVLNQRNTELVLSQDNTNISIPFFLSSKGYGVLWNSASVTDWNNRFRQVLAVRSNDADAVDYYYIGGPSFDKIIAGYRRLSGTAPLFPRWAYGYWQSKLAYASTDQLLGVAAKYRALHIPLDNIVLDAGWETGFGSRTFNPNYPDPKSMVQSLHDQHVHLMVSIWPLFQPGNANFDEMEAKGFFVTLGPNHLPSYMPGARLYDAFSPGARRLYWQQAKKSLYDIGVDAFWMDSTEPADLYAEEHGPMLAGAGTALGIGSKYANLFPLMTTASIYDGQRAQPENKRAFILTRSAFTGMQRNAAAAWSGDTLTTFDSFRRQIPAGLNYSLTGLPYWTSDIGGFVGGDTTDPAYRELFVRWFEYGSFCPIFRAHGARKNNQNELWSFGPQAQQILTLYDRLRYRLMPYIYTLAAKTTFDGYTPMRALAFDFAADSKALDINDEFMFGPSLLVAPVTVEGATSRDVYLPKGGDWYDFWTGQRIAGGQTIHRDAPLGVLPFYVRAGSILPLGPEEEYTGEHPSAPVELRIYPGADGDARLYYDDGLTYGYEKGQYAWVPMHWSDASHTLTIGSRQGQFTGASGGQEFHVTLVAPGHGTGETVANGDHSLTYSGVSQQARF